MLAFYGNLEKQSVNFKVLAQSLNSTHLILLPLMVDLCSKSYGCHTTTLSSPSSTFCPWASVLTTANEHISVKLLFKGKKHTLGEC